MSKRVCCLYRVSTLSQTKIDGIPMQRQACLEFAIQQGWTIVEEKMEKGISGYKVSAQNRDAIQELQASALSNEFDILLVFMFDRLGRKDDETPFIVQWFVKNGIEVWSVKEGQQRFDDHIDNLINYVHYWQAAGESLNTSIRVKARLSQLIKKGRFLGGTVPYGYQLINKGRIGKKNKELYDLEINPDEATVVRKIFNLAAQGYGGRKISTELLKENILNSRGKPFMSSTINTMLGNKVYLGILKSGDVYSDIIAELQIINQEVFDQVQELRAFRRKPDITKNDKDTTLLVKGLVSGYVFCGHCGRMLYTKRKSIRNKHTAEIKQVVLYICENRLYENKVMNACPDGQSTYRAYKIDKIVESFVQSFFDQIMHFYKNKAGITKDQKSLKILTKKLYIKQKEYEDKKEEFIKCCCDTTNESFEAFLRELKMLKQDLQKTKKSLEEAETNHKKDQGMLKRLMKYAKLYENTNFDERRMIVEVLIERIEIKKGYQFDIKLKENVRCFSGMI